MTITFLAVIILTGAAVLRVYASPTNDAPPAVSQFTNLIAAPAITNWPPTNRPHPHMTNWPATNLPALTNPPALRPPGG